MRSGVYHDSVTLLRVSQTAASIPGITAVQVAMATPLNTELAAGLGFAVPEGPAPTTCSSRCTGTPAALEAALHGSSRRWPSRGAGHLRPGRRRCPAADRSCRLLRAPRGAARAAVRARAAVLGEALDAIGAGRHVMIFSDNVPVADEIALKERGRGAGVLVMGRIAAPRWSAGWASGSPTC